MADLGIARLNNEAGANGTLTRADLSDVVHRKLGLSRAESANLVERVLHHMCHALAKGTNVNDIALLHMGANLTVVGLYCIATALQWDDGAREGASLTAVIALHASGTTFLSLAGWLGGEMVFRHHVATLEEEDTSEQSQGASQPQGGAQPRGA